MHPSYGAKPKALKNRLLSVFLTNREFRAKFP